MFEKVVAQRLSGVHSTTNDSGHANGRAHLYRVRIHCSAIVNIDRVQIEPQVHGEYVVTLRDGTRWTSSRAHSRGLRALLER